ncbi:MAG: hypothetical protein FRX49_12150 [Trebouxia sp. A1-2]|nr:MAG: hypothetical protein FRX49_12150 [Trebouxia sp. A1-2]
MQQSLSGPLASSVCTSSLLLSSAKPKLDFRRASVRRRKEASPPNLASSCEDQCGKVELSQDIAAVAQLSDGVLKGLNADRAFLLAPAHLLLQLTGRLPLPSDCLKQFGLHISVHAYSPTGVFGGRQDLSISFWLATQQLTQPVQLKHAGKMETWNPDISRAEPGRSLMEVTHSVVRLVRMEMKVLWLKHKMQEGAGD